MDPRAGFVLLFLALAAGVVWAARRVTRRQRARLDAAEPDDAAPDLTDVDAEIAEDEWHPDDEDGESWKR